MWLRPVRQGGRSESIGKTRPEAGFGIKKSKLMELLPAAMDDTIIKALDEAGFLTFRGYSGLEDFYVYHTKMLSPETSDFRYAEDIRVKNKVIREVRKEPCSCSTTTLTCPTLMVRCRPGPSSWPYPWTR